MPSSFQEECVNGFVRLNIEGIALRVRDKAFEHTLQGADSNSHRSIVKYRLI